MKKIALTIGYFTLVGSLILLNSCQDDPINPNSGDSNPVDSTWVNDSTNNGNNNPEDSTFIDSTYWNGGGNNGGNDDSTDWNNNPGDSTWMDSLGG